MRPCNRARSSPNLFDIHACADSWTDKEKINATMNRMNCPTALLSMSPISNQLSEGIARVVHTNMALETCQKTPKSSIGSVPSPACCRSEGPVVSIPVRECGGLHPLDSPRPEGPGPIVAHLRPSRHYIPINPVLTGGPTYSRSF